jgi:predicted DNA-binding protein (MmcQ/YjbR family)
MFALTDVDYFKSVNLKCDPERAIDLRDKYQAISAGFHMNKNHWNTVEIDGSLSDNFIEELIDHSYDMVVQKLPKSIQAQLTEN